MLSWFRVLGLAALLFAIRDPAIVVAEGEPGAESWFRFNPCGEEHQFVQRVTMTRVKDAGVLGTTVDVSRTETSIRVQRIDGGFLITAKPISSQMTRDGVELDNPFVRAVQAVEMTMKLDGDGHLVEIRGIEEFVDNMMAELPEGARASVSKLINAEMLIAKETAEWNGRIGDFIGATVTEGETWEYEAPFQLPSGGEIPFWTTVTFNRSDSCGQCDCLEIVTSYTSDVSAIAGLVTETVEGVVESAGGSDAAELELEERIEGGGVRVIDPNTMRIYSERMERTMTIRVEQPGMDPFPMTMTEAREFEFDYRDAYCGPDVE
jgi:hypothetical protein